MYTLVNYLHENIYITLKWFVNHTFPICQPHFSHRYEVLGNVSYICCETGLAKKEKRVGVKLK